MQWSSVRQVMPPENAGKIIPHDEKIPRGALWIGTRSHPWPGWGKMSTKFFRFCSNSPMRLEKKNITQTSITGASNFARGESGTATTISATQKTGAGEEALTPFRKNTMLPRSSPWNRHRDTGARCRMYCTLGCGLCRDPHRAISQMCHCEINDAMLIALLQSAHSMSPSQSINQSIDCWALSHLPDPMAMFSSWPRTMYWFSPFQL